MTLTRTFLTAAFAFLLTVAGCDFLDPTETENPQTTADELEGAVQPVSVALPGARAQFSRAIGAAGVTVEVASDNYSVHGSGLSDGVDFQDQLIPTLGLLNTSAEEGLYWNTQELRALSQFVLNNLVPADDESTPEQEAELRFYIGMAYLMQGENFVAAPIEENGEAVAPAQLLQLALEQFNAVLDSEVASFDLVAQAARARTHRALGNATEAASAASAALSTDDDFLFAAPFDRDNLDNAPFDFLIQRALQEMQPLPRLDFLDPKYGQLASGEEPDIPYAKAEEMHLILAEAALSEERFGDARGHLGDVLDLVQSRIDAGFVITFNDDDARFDNSFEVRPNNSSIEIAFEPGAPFQSGLVLDRPGVVSTPSVSGTSVTESDLAAASDAELTYWLYLLRQEIFFLEGRRLHDLGIRLPIMQREIDASRTINEGDLGTMRSVPSYIPPSNEMDLYEPAVIYEDDELTEDEVTMLHDMNRILTDRRGLLIDTPFGS